ncbi:MAG: hypothetical protein ACTHJK_05185 [Sphingomicrobium sp.]
MRIDWAATTAIGTMVQGIGTLLGAVAIIVAAVIGGRTVESWRRQQLAERKIAQSERILEATYKVRRALKTIRTDAMWSGELEVAERAVALNPGWQHFDDAKKRRMRTFQAYVNRLIEAGPKREALDQCLPMARALFGEKLEAAIESLSRQFDILEIDAASYADDNGSDPDFSRQIRRGMYEITLKKGEVDEVSQIIDHSVATIEATCLPVLRS